MAAAISARLHLGQAWHRRAQEGGQRPLAGRGRRRTPQRSPRPCRPASPGPRRRTGQRRPRVAAARHRPGRSAAQARACGRHRTSRRSGTGRRPARPGAGDIGGHRGDRAAGLRRRTGVSGAAVDVRQRRPCAAAVATIGSKKHRRGRRRRCAERRGVPSAGPATRYSRVRPSARWRSVMGENLRQKRTSVSATRDDVRLCPRPTLSACRPRTSPARRGAW